MKIFVNDKKIENDNYKSLTLPKLLKKIKSNLDNEILKKIYVNEVEVNEKYLKESLLDIKDIKKIKFVTQKTKILIKNSLKETTNYLPKLKEGILDAADHFRNGDEEKVNNIYQQILNGIEWYTDVITKILSIIQQDELSKEGQKIIKGLNESLSELMIAYKKDDIILVADILEYEIVDFIDDFINLNDRIHCKFNNISTNDVSNEG